MSTYSLNFSLQAALAQHWLSAPLSAWTAGITQKGCLENNSTEMPNLYIDYLRNSWKYWKKPWTQMQGTLVQFLAQPLIGSLVCVPRPPWTSVSLPICKIKIQCLLPFLLTLMLHGSSYKSTSWVRWGFLQNYLNSQKFHWPLSVEWREAAEESTYSMLTHLAQS